MAWATATFENVLDDLSSRFIINVPDEELASVERICFQIEQAHWYYEDFVREQNPSLPSFNLKNFSAKFFQHCPLLHEWSNEHETAFANFMEYKVRVPVCGAIILNEAMDKCILVKGWTARSGWGFPKGKINKDEPDTSCAVREVWEETGFDVTDKIREEDYVEQTIKDQRIRLYIIKGVSESTVFEPQTRKEISKIEWHFIADLPTSKPKPVEKGTQSGKESGTERASGIKNPSRYYMVTPFIHKLRNWIGTQKRNTKRNKGQSSHPAHSHTLSNEGHQNHSHNHAGVPIISSAEARLDSEVLKSMLGIGQTPAPLQDLTPGQHYTSPPNGMSPTTNDVKNSSDSLKALLGIQSPTGNNMMLRDGMTGGSPMMHHVSAQYHGSRPVSTPSLPSSSSSSTTAAPYQNGSEALKAMLGIPAQPSNSPMSHFHTNGASPIMTNAGAIANGPLRPDFSPQMHYSPVNNSPVVARNGSVDLLALLKGGSGNGAENTTSAVATNGTGFAGGGGGGTQVRNNRGDGGKKSNGNNQKFGAVNNGGLSQGHVANNGGADKPKGMLNFTFDVDALLQQ
ncbi:MAG: Dcp2, box A domain-containing protein [Benniella sp.]|nr:MAG: Dcp2, box A domain-containing protein [Benniella sp.]